VLRLVETCERLGQPEKARAGLERVHQDQPESVEVRNLLWKLYETVGATKELASMLIIDALRVEDLAERFALLRRSGELYLQSPDGVGMAIEPLEEALRLDQMSHETMVLLADAYIATGTLDKASVLLTNAIDTLKRRGPQLADLQHRMARLMAAEGNKDGQLQWLNAALETNKRDGIIAAELAELAMDVGDHTTAQKALRVVTVSRRESSMSLATAFLYQAKIAAAKGEKRQAQMWARRALTEEPDHQAAAEYLRELEEGS
jgi:tetratricopeptide (TPR) repeat protein